MTPGTVIPIFKPSVFAFAFRWSVTLWPGRVPGRRRRSRLAFMVRCHILTFRVPGLARRWPWRPRLTLSLSEPPWRYSRRRWRSGGPWHLPFGLSLLRNQCLWSGPHGRWRRHGCRVPILLMLPLIVKTTVVLVRTLLSRPPARSYYRRRGPVPRVFGHRRLGRGPRQRRSGFTGLARFQLVPLGCANSPRRAVIIYFSGLMVTPLGRTPHRGPPRRRARPPGVRRNLR